MRACVVGMALASMMLSGCNLVEVRMTGQKTFGDDVAFLKEHTDAFVLSDPKGKAQVIVVPAYQGRVMTSTADGPRVPG